MSQPERFRTEPRDHRFFSVAAIAVAALVVFGFAQTYPRALRGGTSLPPIVHFHAAVFVAWLALFIVQTQLVARGRVGLHRRLGTWGIALAASMLLLGVGTAIAVARLGHRGIPGVEFPDPSGFLLLNLASIVVFAALVGFGWRMRHDAQAHKRLMSLATLGALAPPGIARLPLLAGKTPAIAVAALSLLLLGPLYDLATRKRVHRAYLWGLLAMLATLPPIVGAIASTDIWRRVAEWLVA